MLHEGLVDLASQLGHSPTMTLNTNGHVIAELRGGAEAQRGRPDLRGPRPGPQSAPSNEKRDLPEPGRSRCRRRADTRTRTGDPFITSEVLYQLSYVGAGAKCSRRTGSLEALI
jgi:hypothetical protein